MHKIVFQLMGTFALAFAAMLFVGAILTVWHYPPHSPLDLVPLAISVAALTVAGTGLLYLRKWAAVMISLITLYVASWEVKDALHPIPGFANWLGFLFALVLLIPSVTTVVYWKTLRWRHSSIIPPDREKKTED
jgi:hypothetical protein